MTLALRLACAFLLASLLPLHAQSSPSGISWTNYAGLPGGAGNADGTGVAARFSTPSGITRDVSGNLYVTDSANDTIRKIDPSGVVTTFAGAPGQAGAVDEVGGNARFDSPQGITIDAGGNLYVSDAAQRIVRIAPDGTAQTIAGTAGVAGSQDGMQATFMNPTGLAVAANGDVFIADTGNNKIRVLSPDGNVSTLAGNGTAGFMDGAGSQAQFSGPTGVAVDAAGNVYVADQGNQLIRLIDAGGNVTTYAGMLGTKGGTDSTGTAASFSLPTGVALDASGNLFVSDQGGDTIRKITPQMVVSTPAGLVGTPGRTNGTGSNAHFFLPLGLVVDPDGNVFVADSGNDMIREITPANVVTTVAGTPTNPGSVDGSLESARLNGPRAIATDTAGNVYVADTANNTIRKIGSGNSVTTIAGTAGVTGHADGTGTAATFNAPQGIVVDGGGNVYVADTGNHTIRKIAATTNVVTTLTGVAGTAGSLDGTGTSTTTGARFNSPRGIDIDLNGNLIVADTGNHKIRKVTTAGAVTTVAGSVTKVASVSTTSTSTTATLTSTGGLVVGEIISGNTNIPVGTTIAAVVDGTHITLSTAATGTAASVTTTFTNIVAGDVDGAPGTALFISPNGVAVASNGVIYVTEGDSAIRKIITGNVVSTLAGSATQSGNADGVGTAATFEQPSGLTLDARGNLLVTDSKAGTVRKITPAGVVTTIGGTPGVVGGVDLGGQSGLVGSAAEFSSPTGIAVNSTGSIFVADTGNNQIQVGTPLNLSTDHTLSGLTVSAGPLTPDFNPATTTYSLTVDGSVTSTTVTPILNSAAAQETVNGVPVVPGATSASIPLRVGANTIAVLVTAEDNSQGTYTISITVTDTEAPVFSFVPSDVTAVADSAAGATVYFLTATATDNSGKAPTITYTMNSGSVFPIGTSSVTVTAADGSGNASTASFNVTVFPWRQQIPAVQGEGVGGAGVTGSGVPTGSRYRTFGTPGLDSTPTSLPDGAPVFRATFNGAGLGVQTGIFGEGGKAPLVAKTGDLAAGTSTQSDPTKQDATNTAKFATLSEPLGNGGTAAIATLTHKAGLASAANDQGIWSNAFSDSAQTFGLVARKGSPAPAMSGQAEDSALYSSFTAAALNDGGHLFWVSKLTGVPAASGQALFVQSSAAGPAERLLQMGETVAVGAATQTVKSFLALNAPSVFATGVSGYGAGQANGGSLVPVLLTFTGAGTPRAIATVGPSHPLTVFATTGQAVPAGAGISAGANWQTLGQPSMGGNGALAFHALVGTPTAKISAVFLQPAGGVLSAIARQGDPAPGFTGRSYGVLGDPSVDTVGDVMFFAQIAATATAPKVEQLYFLGVGMSTPTRVACTGDTAPDENGMPLETTPDPNQMPPSVPQPIVEYSSFTGAALPSSTATTALGGPVFTAVLKNGPKKTSVKASNNVALFAMDHSGSVRMLVRTGSKVGGKILKKIGAFRYVAGSPLQARTAGAADSVIYLATFGDNTTAIEKADVP